MNLALVTPYYFPSVRGNSVTVQRIESGLREEGMSVSVFSLLQPSGICRVRFGSPEEFLKTAGRLPTEPATAGALGQRVRRKMATPFTREGETGGHLALFGPLTGKEA